MENIPQIKDLLQKAIDILCKSKMYEEDYMLVAQKLGLQGEKRRLRYESGKNHKLINDIRCDAFDTYGLTLTNKVTPITAPPATTMKDFFENYLEKMDGQYDALHGIANQLITLNAKCAAMPLYEKCSCLIDDIKFYNRTIMEGEIVGWKPEFMLLREVTAENVHDTFEKKED